VSPLSNAVLRPTAASRFNTATFDPNGSASPTLHSLKLWRLVAAPTPGCEDWCLAITVRPAESGDAAGIARVCAEGWRDTYADIYTPEHVESVIAEYYTVERIRGEIAAPDGWDGWIVAVEVGSVVGAGGGGMIEPGAGEVFVLYLDPSRRREGIGTLLLDAITDQQLAQGAREQWVSVEPENERGLPFYEARGFQVQGKRSAWGSAPEEARFSLRLVRRLDQSRAQRQES